MVIKATAFKKLVSKAAAFEIPGKKPWNPLKALYKKSQLFKNTMAFKSAGTLLKPTVIFKSLGRVTSDLEIRKKSGKKFWFKKSGNSQWIFKFWWKSGKSQGNIFLRISSRQISCREIHFDKKYMSRKTNFMANYLLLRQENFLKWSGISGKSQGILNLRWNEH